MRASLCRSLACVSLVSVAAAGALAAEPDERPETVVRAALDRALVVLADESLGAGEKRRALEAVAFEQFEFPTMSKLVLARAWRGFDETQRRDFVAEFKRELSHNYGSRLERYSREQVDITGSRVEARGDVTVLTRVAGGRFDGAELRFRLRPVAGRWLGIDVVVEGVSLVASYRAQFKEALADAGPDALIARLRDRNDARDGELGR